MMPHALPLCITLPSIQWGSHVVFEVVVSEWSWRTCLGLLCRPEVWSPFPSSLPLDSSICTHRSATAALRSSGPACGRCRHSLDLPYLSASFRRIVTLLGTGLVLWVWGLATCVWCRHLEGEIYLPDDLGQLPLLLRSQWSGSKGSPDVGINGLTNVNVRGSL